MISLKLLAFEIFVAKFFLTKPSFELLQGLITMSKNNDFPSLGINVFQFLNHQFKLLLYQISDKFFKYKRQHSRHISHLQYPEHNISLLLWSANPMGPVWARANKIQGQARTRPMFPERTVVASIMSDVRSTDSSCARSRVGRDAATLLPSTPVALQMSAARPIF